MIAACDVKQASIAFQEVAAIVTAVPEFRQFEITVSNFWKRAEVRAGPSAGTTFEVLTGEAKRGHGLSPTLWLYDELGIAPNRMLLDALQTAAGKRDRSLGIIISTQAADDRHPLSQLIDDALTGTDPTIVCQLIAAADDEDSFDEAVIRRVNPALGIFLNEKEIMRASAQAARSPAFQPAFENLRLNRRVSVSAERRLLAPAQWELGNKPVDEASLAGKECVGGLDLSQRIDLTALVLAFEDKHGNHDLLCRFWTPLEAMEGRTQAEKELFELWLRQGHLIGIPGPVIRLEFVAHEILALSRRYKIKAIHYDRAYIKHLQIALTDINCNVELVEHGQGYMSFGPSVSRFIELAVSGQIRHGGNPVLTAAILGAAVTSDPAGNLKLDKRKSEGQAICRIDPAVAAVMALGSVRKEPPKFQMIMLDS